MKKQQSGSEYRMLNSFSRAELYELLNEKGQVGIHLGGRWYGILKILKKEHFKETSSNGIIATSNRIFLFSDHTGYQEEWGYAIKKESYQGYKYAFMIFYDRPRGCWVFPDSKIFIHGITLYDL